MLNDHNASLSLGKILSLPAWTPFSILVASPERERFFQQFLYHLNGSMYLSLAPMHGRTFEEEGGPFMTGIIWGTDAGAVSRAWSMEIEADQGSCAMVPPEFLPVDSVPTYGSILLALKSMDPTSCIEAASYRIATDGRFAFRSIQTKDFEFYFRNHHYDDGESPFAVFRKLKERAADRNSVETIVH